MKFFQPKFIAEVGTFIGVSTMVMDLAVETEERDPSTNQFRQMIYSTSVLVRNHAIN